MPANIVKVLGNSAIALRLALLGLALSWCASASGQTSSLFRQDLPVGATQLTLSNTSFLYQPPEPVRVYKLHDNITVIVSEKSQVTSQADVQRRKQAQLDAELKDWVKLENWSIKKAPQAQGDPAVNATLQAQFRANSDLETRDLMTFRIAAEVVDVRPNGYLVLEAHQKLGNNEELWVRSLSGIINPEDVLPNRTVLSDRVLELHISKFERGHVRDGYRRGWLYRLMDKYGAF